MVTKEFVPHEFGDGSEVVSIDSPPESRAHVGAAARRVLLEAVLHEVANERRVGSRDSVQVVELRFPVGLPLVALPLDVVEQPLSGAVGFRLALHHVDDAEARGRCPPRDSCSPTSSAPRTCNWRWSVAARSSSPSSRAPRAVRLATWRPLEEPFQGRRALALRSWAACPPRPSRTP